MWILLMLVYHTNGVQHHESFRIETSSEQECEQTAELFKNYIEPISRVEYVCTEFKSL